jgi:AraC-like DNA-binding protein
MFSSPRFSGKKHRESGFFRCMKFLAACAAGKQCIFIHASAMTEIFDNIRKLYEFSPPCPELARHIEFFSESSADATRAFACNSCFNVKMFASWTPTFWFNLGPAYNVKMDNKQYHIPKGMDVLVIRNNIVERLNHPTDHIFTVKFFPGGLEAILGIDQSHLQNRVVDLRQILPTTIIQQVKAIGHFAGRMQVLQQFFLGLLNKNKQRDSYIQFVRDTIACYEQGELKYNVTELSGHLFTTSKTITRYFNKVVGTSPRQYFNILRARTALSAWVNDRYAFDPTDFGYYDPSHFYKEMKKFTGHHLSQAHF